MAKSICIVCGEEKQGIEVEQDWVINTIRWFKRNVTKNEQGNRLVVCKECYPKYAIMRKKYEGREKLYLALGIIFTLFSLFVASDKLYALGVGILVTALLYAFSLLSYTPKLKMPKQENAATAQSRHTGKR
ncbi:MAG: hypothetical protein ACP5T3_00350 [Candidatus Micrarchaeia archaeon]